MRPSSTYEYSSSRLWRCSGAASARGGIGCSTSEKPPAWVSSVSIMKRTPIAPRLPALPSRGPTIFGAVWVSMGGAYLSMNDVFSERRGETVDFDERHVN